MPAIGDKVCFVTYHGSDDVWSAAFATEESFWRSAWKEVTEHFKDADEDDDVVAGVTATQVDTFEKFMALDPEVRADVAAYVANAEDGIEVDPDYVLG